MAIFPLLLSSAIACSALLMPAFVVAQNFAASRPDASSEFENTVWKLIRNSDDPADFETYIEIYPTGRFNRVARQRVSELTEQPRRSALLSSHRLLLRMCPWRGNRNCQQRGLRSRNALPMSPAGP